MARSTDDEKLLKLLNHKIRAIDDVRHTQKFMYLRITKRPTPGALPEPSRRAGRSQGAPWPGGRVVVVVVEVDVEVVDVVEVVTGGTVGCVVVEGS